MKRIRWLGLLILGGVILSQPVAWSATSFNLIDEALRKGEIDYGTSLLYKLYALHRSDALETRFRGDEKLLLKSATPLYLEIWQNLNRLDGYKDSLIAFFARPTEPGEAQATGGVAHTYEVEPTFYAPPDRDFKIWYVTTTDDAPELVDVSPLDGVPDYINLCAQVMDSVWHYEIHHLGFRRPQRDTLYPAGQDFGGDFKFDVYVQSLPEGYYGVTVPEYEYYEQYASCYLVIDDDYIGYPTPGEDGLKVTVAHEFFHAIQFAFDAYEDRYFMEISSTWMEDQAYDDVNDYRFYLPYFFNDPQKSLFTTDGGHEYASCIWAFYLTERYDTVDIDIMREIWEECENKTSFEAFETALYNRGTDVQSAFQEFTAWNYFTGWRANPARYYEEGAGFGVDVAIARTHESFNQIDTTESPYLVRPAHFGANYVKFISDGRIGGLQIAFDGDNSVSWRATVLGYGQDSSFVRSIWLDQRGDGKIAIEDWGLFYEIVLVPAVVSTRTGSYSYRYAVAYDHTLFNSYIPPSRTRVYQNYPNPFLVKTHAQTYFPFDLSQRSEVRLRIFTPSGELVRELRSEPLELMPGSPERHGTDRLVWDGKNEAGQTVADGIYLYQFQAGTFTETRKMAVLNK